MSIQIPDELLVAYLDGDLDDAARARIERALSNDSALAQRIARERQMRARQESRGRDGQDRRRVVPMALRSSDRTSAGTSAQVIDLARVRAQRSRRSERHRFAVPRRTLGAFGATLAVGILAGLGTARLLAGAHPAEYRGGSLQATGQLAQALENQLSTHLRSGSAARVSASFRSRDGGFCRTFQLDGKPPISGLACREQDHWRIVTMLSAEPAAPNAPLSRLSSASPSLLQQAISERTSGAALDSDAETRAQEGGWR